MGEFAIEFGLVGFVALMCLGCFTRLTCGLGLVLPWKFRFGFVFYECVVDGTYLDCGLGFGVWFVGSLLESFLWIVLLCVTCLLLLILLAVCGGV